MQTSFISVLIFLFLLGALMGITIILHRYFHWPSEQSRKFLHVSGGVLSLFLPLFFHSHVWVMAITGIAFLLLLVTYMRKWMPSVHATNRYSLGSVLFPLPVYGCFLMAAYMHDNLYFWLPISLLTFSDTAAETGGHLWGTRTRSFFNGQKTMAGTLSFGVTAIIVNCCWLLGATSLPLQQVIILTVMLTLFCSLAELITLHGCDNITIPATALLILYFFR